MKYLLVLIAIVGSDSIVRVEPPVERIQINDNQRPAGTLTDGVLTLQLEVREGLWFPASDSGLSQLVQAFGEVGKPLQIPGPLIRIPLGTQVRVSVHNSSGGSVTIHGLMSRPAAQDDSIVIQANVTREVVVEFAQAGTFFYWGSTTGSDLESRVGLESQLSGAIVVDSGEATRTDRVFVLGVWGEPIDSTGPRPWVPRDVMVINGKMWPYTERFSYGQGDSVHWRWLNPTADSHPMHLHGFFYSVENSGTWVTDTVLAPGDRRQVVTELMLPGSTMAMSWVAARPGNWLFHCHFAFHVSHYLSLEKVPDPVDPGAANAVDHSVHGMMGLVLGMQVRPREGSATVTRKPASTPRRLRIAVRPVPRSATQEEPYAFVVRGDRVAGRDSSDPMLVLGRNERVEITVVNELHAPTSLHWHGIEVEDSYMDGVPGWSGTGEHLAPLIMPGDSFLVEFTPPRQGTYMYHSHSNEGHQIGNGLYAPILVMDEADTYDRNADRVFIFGGEGDSARINRQSQPKQTRMVVGRTYRIRVINIHPDRRMVFTMESNSGRMVWRAIGKDGADLPAQQATVRPARILMGPGETADFSFTPERAGPIRFEAIPDLDPKWKVVAPIEVRDR